MIIDFHTHVFSPSLIERRGDLAGSEPLFGGLYSSPQAKLATVDELIASMDSHNIDVSVIQNIQWANIDLCRESNDYIIESVARYPGRLRGFIMVNLTEPAAAIQEIERCTNSGIKGIGEVRLSPANLQNINLLKPAIQTMINRGLILLTHASEPVGHLYPGKGDSTPESLYSFITAFPELKLVCAHWGGGLPFYALMPEVKQALKNVYFDSAASPFLYAPAVYRQVVHLIGAEKVLFGSDYPLLSPARLIREIGAAGLGTERQNMILAGNAARLLEINQ
jgi:uncharacterized protein